MGRPARGNIERDANGKPVAVRVTLKTGEPLRIKLEPGCTEAQAQTDRAFWAAQAAAGMKAPEKKTVDGKTAAGAETVEAYAKRWLQDRTARGLSSAEDNGRTLANHILPAFGPLPVASVTRADVKSFVEHLDSMVTEKTIASKTAINIWTLTTKLFADMQSSKKSTLCVREDNPATGVRGPDRTPDRDGPYLFPRELVALLSCAEIPLRWRVIYAFAAYTGLRRGELVTLRPASVHLDAGYIAVTKAHDRTTKGEKGTKSGRARKVPIEPALRPLAEALVKHPQGPDGRLLDMPPERTIADNLRRDAQRARLTRAELFADDDQRRPLTFHSLRHGYATHLALSGVDAMVIQQRGGWADLGMVQRYVEEAEVIGQGDIGKPFPTLPATLVAEVASSGVSEGVLAESAPRTHKTPRKSVGGTGFEPATSGL